MKISYNKMTFKKRQILDLKTTTEKAPEPESEDPPQQRELTEEEVFQTTKASELEIQEVKPPETLEQSKKEKYAYLAEARKKSLEVRRKKASEKKQLKQKVDERVLYEQLKAKFGEPTAKVVPENYPISKPVETPPIPEPKIVETPRAASAIQDVASPFDYDRIVNALSEKMTNNQQYLRDLEERIRLDERKKHQAELEKFKHDQHRKTQAEIGRSLLTRGSRRNRVFQQTADLRRDLAERYKNSWY